MKRWIGRSAILMPTTVVFVFAWTAPPNAAEHIEGGNPARERPQVRQKTSLEESLEGHKVVARSCEKPRGFRRITIKAGTKFARAGEVFAFDKRAIRVGRCEELEVVLENLDDVRHALMTPGLNPMFMLEFRGRGTKIARFVTPDEDVTLDFHCHVPTHEDLGMAGVFIVGKGGKPKEPPAATAGRRFEGVGELIAVQPRKSRVVVDHEEIKDFMAPMVMSYQVTSAKLLQGLKTGDKIRFTIDADKRAIVNIVPLTFRGEGTVILADTRRGQIVVDHKEIPGFIGAMTMRYPVRPARLLTGLAAGDRIRFTIDADERAIVDIKPYAE